MSKLILWLAVLVALNASAFADADEELMACIEEAEKSVERYKRGCSDYALCEDLMEACEDCDCEDLVEACENLMDETYLKVIGRCHELHSDTPQISEPRLPVEAEDKKPPCRK